MKMINLNAFNCIDLIYNCDKIPHCNDTSDEPTDCKLKSIRSSFPLYHILLILTSITVFISVSLKIKKT